MLFRAFYALPESIKGADGNPVNALLGTANLILREVEAHDPRAVVLCFGPDAAAYRAELYPAYHAEREAACPTSCGRSGPTPPTSSRPSAGRSRPATSLEADDLLGSYARRGGEGGRRSAAADRRPRHVPVRERERKVLYVRTGQAGRPRSSAPAEVQASATGSRPSSSPTSSPCAATPPTASRAPRASARRPPPSCCASTARWRRCSTPRSASRARAAHRADRRPRRAARLQGHRHPARRRGRAARATRDRLRAAPPRPPASAA